MNNDVFDLEIFTIIDLDFIVYLDYESNLPRSSQTLYTCITKI